MRTFVGWEKENHLKMGKKETGGDSSDDEKTSKKWSGTVGDMTDWEKSIARWCRKKWGTTIGNLIWEDDLPVLDDLTKYEYDSHLNDIWDCINDSNSTQAKELWPVTSGFWLKKWQEKCGKLANFDPRKVALKTIF